MRTHVIKRNGSTLWLFTAVFAALFILSCTARADSKLDPEKLWIDFSLGPPLLDTFNFRAQPQDIARVEHISQLDLLKSVTAGQKLVVFKSAVDAMRLIPHIHDEIDIVGFNLEHGPANPRNEQDNPVEAIRELRDVADRYNLKIALGPDRRFAESHGAAMAPYADYFILQVQKVQTQPQTVTEFVRPLVRQIRAANPDVQISVQIRTEGSVDDLLELLGSLQGDLDGVSILTSVETVPVAEELMAALRPNATPPTPTPQIGENRIPVVEGSGGAAAPLAVGAEEPERPRAAVSLPQSDTLSTSEVQQRTGSTWLFVLLGVTLVVVVSTGYISYRSLPRRE